LKNLKSLVLPFNTNPFIGINLRLFVLLIVLSALGCSNNHRIPRHHKLFKTSVKTNITQKVTRVNQSEALETKNWEISKEKAPKRLLTKQRIDLDTGIKDYKSIEEKVTKKTKHLSLSEEKSLFKNSLPEKRRTIWRNSSEPPKRPIAVKVIGIVSFLLLLSSIFIFLITGGGWVLGLFGIVTGFAYLSEKYRWAKPPKKEEKKSNPPDKSDNIITFPLFMAFSLTIISLFLGIIGFSLVVGSTSSSLIIGLMLMALGRFMFLLAIIFLGINYSMNY